MEAADVSPWMTILEEHFPPDQSESQIYKIE
jgi:hypothetical protein